MTDDRNQTEKQRTNDRKGRDDKSTARAPGAAPADGRNEQSGEGSAPTPDIADVIRAIRQEMRAQAREPIVRGYDPATRKPRYGDAN